MSGRRNKSKDKIQISKPDLPPFLQRIKEQIVVNEANERKEQSDRKRKDRPKYSADPEDNPTIVKLDDDDLSEEEYKKLKKGDEDSKEPKKPKSPDMSALITKSDTIKKEAKHGNKKLTYVSSSSDEDN